MAGVIEMDNVPDTEIMIPHNNEINYDSNNDEQNRKIRENHRTQLLEALKNNNGIDVQDLIEQYPTLPENSEEDLRTYQYEVEINGKSVTNSILIISCIDDRINENTLGKLFSAIKDKYGNAEYTDEKRFGWEPMHYIASTANFKKLKTFLNYKKDKKGEKDKKDINSLTYFAENALHILLQYEKSASPFAVILKNNRESRSSTIIGTERQDVVKCAKTLIMEGIDVNQTNFWNESPICLAVRYRYIKIIQFLLTVDYIDLDSFKECGKTIREYLKWNLYITIPRSYVQEDPIRIRFNFLKSGDEDNFLTYNTDSLSDNVNAEDSCTMLQFCMRKGFLEYLQDEQYKIKRLINYDIKDTPMLTIFNAKGLKRCIIHLLDNGADSSKTTRKFKENILEYSAVRGYYPFVAILLQHKNSEITISDIFKTLSKIYERNFELHSHKFYRNCVLYLLLNKIFFLYQLNLEDVEEDEIIYRKEILNTLLCNLNLENDDQLLNDSEIIYQILHLGGSLTHNMIVERMDITLLKNHFDDCIYGTTFKYNTIIEDNNNYYDENKILDYLVINNHKRSLLTHPLMIELIREKWSKIYWVFYADLLFYTLLLFAIYGFMVSIYFGHSTSIFNIFYYIFMSVHIIKESIQFIFLYKWKYILDMTNILETVTIGCCLFTNFLPNIYSLVASILLSTCILFLILAQAPFLTKYTIIFSSIKYFFEYLAFYSILFFAFSICFYIVFPFDKSNFSGFTNSTGPDWGDITKSLFFTLVYFTGEFSDRVLEPTGYPIFGRIMMTFFIFSMTIILNNLLVGLIVADMENIQQTGRLYKQVKFVRFMQSTNTFIKGVHEFIPYKCITKLRKYLNLFETGKYKVFQNVDIQKFNIDTINQLKEIQKNHIFDKYLLREVYNQINHKCILYLLDIGADTKPTPKFKQSLLEYSAVRGYYPFVAILLQHKSNITISDILNVLSQIHATDFKLHNHEFYKNCVLYLLLNKLIFLFRQNKKDDGNKEILTSKRQYILNKLLYKLNLECDDERYNSSEIIYQILHLGGSLTYAPDNSKMVVERLDSTMLKTHFDDCIHGTTFNYNSIIQDDNYIYNENRTLHSLVIDNYKRELLTHPLIEELIHKKWKRIYLVFYADLLLYTLFFISVYAYMICLNFKHYFVALNIIYFLLVFLHLIKEIIQFIFLYRLKYILEPTNILETATLICCLITSFIPNIYTLVLSILFSTCIFFVLLSQLPIFTKYTIIFSSIKYFFEYLGFYSIQFVAFSICFYLVFPFDDDKSLNWGDIAKSLFFTLVYFTGEFGDRVTEPTEYPVFGRILMTLFIFCMTIILNNLLVGLIVADMDDIQRSARLYKQIKTAKFIQSTNTFIKRIHDYKSFDFIKNIINHINVFHKGHEKQFKNVNIHKFDVENKKLLREIRKMQIFDRHMLRDIYKQIVQK